MQIMLSPTRKHNVQCHIHFEHVYSFSVYIINIARTSVLYYVYSTELEGLSPEGEGYKSHTALLCTIQK